MARFSTIVSVAVLVVVCLYMVNVVEAQNQQCSTPNGCAPGMCSGNRPQCCDGLREGVADDGSVYAIQTGRCTCCAHNENCRTLAASSLADNPNTTSDAQAVDVDCKVPQE